MSDLAPILAKLAACLGPHGQPQALDGGITNRNYRVRFGEADYVVRVPSKDTALLGIDRRTEWAAAGVAAGIGVGPAIGAMFDEPACLVTRYIEGRQFELSDFDDPTVIRDVARALRAMHESGAQLPSEFSVFDVVARYADAVRNRGARLPDGFGAAARRAKAIRKALRGPEHDPVPCHNDLLAANLLHDGTRVRIVDWEYSGMGDRYFDLGNFAVNNELDEAGMVTLLDAYWGRPPSPSQLAALHLMRFMSDLRESMWGAVQRTASELDFDFAGYSAKHFERLTASAADPRFDRWLKEARGAKA